MLIIFDLDDTLIDTSGSIIPVKLRAALKAMIKAGLKVPLEEKAYQTLLGINADAPNGREALKEFLDSIRADARFLEAGVREYYGATATEVTALPLPKVIEVLQELGVGHDLALVSTGDETQQHFKMRKANIDHRLFQRIIICEGYSKKAHYKKLLQEFGVKPREVLVCGDKFETDLLPAKELNMVTVQMCWGRQSGLPPKEDGPDYTIRTLSELHRIVGERA